MTINMKKILIQLEYFFHNIHSFMTVHPRKKPFLTKIPFIINLLVSIFFIFFFFGSIILSFYKKAASTPYPIFVPQNVFYLIGFCIINILIIFTLYKIAKFLGKFNFYLVVAIILSIFFLLQILFIVFMPAAQCFDPEKVINFAKQFIDRNYTAFKFDNYLNYYPNNIGITLFFALIFKVLPTKALIIDGFILRIVNVFFSMLIVVFSLAIYKEFVSSNKNSLIFVLLVLTTYPVTLMENTLVYNNIISTALCMIALYFAKKFIVHNKFIHIILVAIFLMVGNFIRPTALLFLGAIVLYFIINSIFYRNVNIIKTILGIILIIYIFNIPFKVFNNYAVKNGIVEEAIGRHSNPPWRWINIGLPYDNKLGYWDDGRNINIFRKTFKCDKDKASEFFEFDIKVKVESLGALNIAKGYIKKAYWLWTEGTYDINFISLGDTTIDTYFIYETPLNKYFHSRYSHARSLIIWYLYSYNWLVMLAVIFILIYSIKHKNFKLDLLFYVLLAFFAFYLIWEIKGRYLLNIFPILLLIYTASIEKIAASKLSFVNLKKYLSS